jgi:hypothetical protein
MKKRLYNGRPTVEERIFTRISRSKDEVFIPADFKDIASYPQVLRALKQLIKEQKVIRFGYGVYARARINQYDGNLYPDGDIANNLMQLWNKLGVKWDYSQFVKDYNNGVSTQVPIRKLFVVKDRFSRNLNNVEDLYVK